MNHSSEHQNKINTKIIESAAVRQARALALPIVALESTVITHGLPQGENLKLAKAMETTVEEN
ncbi:MAG TPA: pseudouridine-5'-phosphate glycosidase, partial [Anaerolineaceae bacterium]|nr:pseudouridine-5'-phosphate glycosidase [Anaerolineaceae bacterium]